MTRVLSAGLPALAMLMLVDPAQAQETGHNVKPILDLRLRAEEVDQDGLDSTLALTLAGRFGLDAKFTNGFGMESGISSINESNKNVVPSPVNSVRVLKPYAMLSNMYETKGTFNTNKAITI